MVQSDVIHLVLIELIWWLVPSGWLLGLVGANSICLVVNNTFVCEHPNTVNHFC